LKIIFERYSKSEPQNMRYFICGDLICEEEGIEKPEKIALTEAWLDPLLLVVDPELFAQRAAGEAEV
jgi:hypothetical protein